MSYRQFHYLLSLQLLQYISGAEQCGIIYQHIQIPGSVCHSAADCLLHISFQHGRNIYIFQTKTHILTADTADRDRTDAFFPETVKIHIPEPGNINSILSIVIDGNDYILSARYPA